MFSDVSAWFSTSVDSQTKQLWKDQGGYESDSDSADFVFSADNSCPDTLRVFSSKAYVIEHLEVFHSRYISDCVKAGNRSSIILGRYVLPPQDILNDVRKHTTLCWDIPDPRNQPSRPNSRNVIIRSPSRSQHPQNRTGPLTPHQSQTSRQDGASQPSRAGTVPNVQPVGATTQHSASSSSGQQNRRSGESSSNLQDNRLSERRPTQGANRASTSLQQQNQASATKRQVEEQRRSSAMQRNQNSATVRADETAGQKRAVEASTSAVSPTKRRNTAHGDNSIREAGQQAFSPRTRNSVQTNASDSHSVQHTNNHQQKESTEVRSPRRRETTTIRTSPHLQRIDQRNQTSGGGDMSRNVVVADVHTSGINNSVVNPGQPDNRSDHGGTHRGRLSEATDEGVFHISQLMKVMASELSDFVPMKGGAEVYHKSVQ